jgi:MarR family transcriptional regulator, transcriptional regulator for hemolysin
MNSKRNMRSEFARTVISVGRTWRRIVDEALSESGFSQATAVPLLFLLDGPTRQCFIAQSLGLEGPSLVRVIDQLVAEKLVVRQEDASDRRAKILSLTGKGQQRARLIEEVFDRLRREILADISDEQLASTVRLLKKVEEKELHVEQQSLYE